jgi:hypothetical protein
MAIIQFNKYHSDVRTQEELAILNMALIDLWKGKEPDINAKIYFSPIPMGFYNRLLKAKKMQRAQKINGEQS